jgi:microcystin-dependent protein
MSLTKFTGNTNNIQSLPDKPTQSSTELKILFDKAGVDIKNYLNQILTEELDSKESNLRQLIQQNTSNISNMLNTVYPIGSIYMSVNNTNPSTIFGGTWVSWGAGKVPVGVNANETEFNSVEKTGGAKTHTLTTQQIPSHTHAFHGNAHNHSLNNHTHSIPPLSGWTDYKDLSGRIWNVAVQSSGSSLDTNGVFGRVDDGGKVGYAEKTKDGGLGYSDTVEINVGHSHVVSTNSSITGQSSENTGNATQTGYNDNTGGGQAHNNLQPYITCYMWKRTA